MSANNIMAGCGFARMAWELAQYRRWRKWLSNGPLERHELGTLDGPSAEYYRLIDSATASWPAFAGERSAGICPRVGL